MVKDSCGNKVSSFMKIDFLFRVRLSFEYDTMITCRVSTNIISYTRKRTPVEKRGGLKLNCPDIQKKKTKQFPLYD